MSFRFCPNKTEMALRRIADLIPEDVKSSFKRFICAHNSIPISCNQVTLVSALDVCADDSTEILLTYSHTTRFHKLPRLRRGSTVAALNTAQSLRPSTVAPVKRPVSAHSSEPGRSEHSSESGRSEEYSLSLKENSTSTSESAAPLIRTESACGTLGAPIIESPSTPGDEQSSMLSESITEFHWNAEPITVIPAAPYILAFTKANTIEIRLIVNGNLVHTMVLPHLKHIASKVHSDLHITFSVSIYSISLLLDSVENIH